MRKRQGIRLLLLHCLFPLLPGLLIYLFYRRNTVLSTFLQELFSVTPRQPSSSLGSVFIYSFPDFCWSYSLTAALLLYSLFVWKSRSFMGVLAFLLVLFSEVGQPLFAKGFTFDYFDLVASLLGFGFAFLLLKQHRYGP